ncbi:site-specific DNA recombinase [Halolactibacillus halophilus]|uniref:Integrase n=1 Tax=Halolactibacillus halophilus TaxID=306540 RepID=A0A1I5LEK2_9BACI|nr:recombinase family protein [Halolactibacillus halophilus]GEM00862.1 integrase [Halolactibacillus halophilus]SFO95625.1 site-specific DNA recombinase [Halolactibacillus halophilus]
MNKTAIYVRVSTQEQVMEGYSIGAQTEKLKSYCSIKDWTIYDIYTDGGFSGSNMERPGLTKLIHDVRQNKINNVLVYKLDRLSRSQKDTLYLIEDVFLKHHVNFVSINENFDTSSPFGRAMIGILSVFAQLEREQIKERSHMGRVERAKEGYFHGGGFIPIGYDYVGGVLIINEYEAMQVRKVFKLFLNDTPIDRIQKTMNSKYTYKSGNWGSHSVVRNVITNNLYIGKVSFGGKSYDGKHQPIIDEEVFNEANKRYAARSNIKGKSNPFKSKHLLTGLLYCGNCGARYFAKGNYSGRGENKRYYPYYTCYSRAKTNKKLVVDPTCKNTSFPVVKLEPIIIEEIKKLAFDPSRINEIKGQVPKKENDQPVIESRIAELDKQISRMLDLYQNNNMPFEQITARIEQLNDEKESLTDELNNLDINQPTITIDQAAELLSRASDILDNGSVDERRKLIHSLIDRITIYDTDFEIQWSFT